jgi:hypothetical protein
MKTHCPYCAARITEQAKMYRHIALAHPEAVENADIRDNDAISAYDCVEIEKIWISEKRKSDESSTH